MNASKVIVDDNVNADYDADDDLSYFYNCQTQINSSRVAIVSIRDSNEEEDMDSKNYNLNDILSLNQDLEQINVESSFKNFSSDLDMDLDNFIVNFTDCNFNNNGLEINLVSAKLNVDDYNLEYYIFTNLYVIADNVNLNNTPIYNYIQNHSFNTKQTTTPTINKNDSILNIETNFNQEFLIKTCFIEDSGEFLINLINTCFIDDYDKFLIKITSSLIIVGN